MRDFSIFDSFAKGEKRADKSHGTNCVIYTRVSTKEQADNNLSLETQRKGCYNYAERQGYSVLANFGGTYESAQTDERKEFTAMLDYVKKARKKISYILVYSLERFSRNDNSIWLSNQLRKLGIEIISVTQPIDTSNPSGQMQQKMLFLFGEFDNHLRKQKCMAGIRDMLHRGDWPTSPPIGYDTVRSNGKRTIEINEKGKLIRQAFNWKANEGVTNEEIRIRLASRGMNVGHQKISDIFRNPFYCGLLAHKMLDGEVVKGNHQPLISKEIFLKVNGFLDKNARGYSIVEENEKIPLKRFMHCDTCEKPMRGYLVKNRNIHYYKCNSKGCNNNKNAEALHNNFREILNYFSLADASDNLKALIRKQAAATFNQLTQVEKDDYKLLAGQQKEIEKKLQRLEERFIEEEINKDLYDRYSEKYMLEKKEIEKNLKNSSKGVSNIEDYIDLATEFAVKMASGWDSSDYITKQAIQNLVFPEGIYYNKKTDRCRTNRVNLLFSYIAHYKGVISEKERGISKLPLDYASFAGLVARAGIEPTTFGL